MVSCAAPASKRSSDTLLLAFYDLCVLSIQVEVMDKNILTLDTTLGTAQIEVSNAVGSS